MRIEKKDTSRDTSTLKDTVPPKTVHQIVGLLTRSVISCKEGIIVHTPHGYLRINPANYGPSGRTSRYDLGEALALRNCLILLGPEYANTVYHYAKPGDGCLYDIFMCNMPSEENAEKVTQVCGPHLESMGMRITRVRGGMLIENTRRVDGKQSQ